MSKLKKDTIEAKGFSIQIYTEDFKNDYISLTDIARFKNINEPKDVVKNWLRVRDTIEFLGLWETINNPNFKGVEFDSFRKEAGTNAFTLSPQRWIENTNAIGITEETKKLGITFTNINVENISLPDEVEKLIDEQSGMGIASKDMKNYVQYQSIRAMRDASRQEVGLVGLRSRCCASEIKWLIIFKKQLMKR